MSGKTTRYAQIRSDNSLSLGFPYSGRNYGQLTVRQHPKYGLDVIFQVEKGQLMCNGHRGCVIAVKFDDKAPMTFSADGPEDNSTEVAFLRDEGRFINAARGARRILVQVTMFRAGNQLLEFTAPEPLKWPQGKK